MKSQKISDYATGVGHAEQVTVNNYNSAVAKRPAAIAKLVAKICSYAEHEPIDKTTDYTEYEIENKLKYNNVIAYRWLIEEYGEYGHMVDNAYAAVSEGKPGAREQTLKYIKRTYMQKRGEALLADGTEGQTDIDIVRKVSDKIIKSMVDHLKDFLLNSENCPEEESELLHMSIENIVGHAFVECSILEKPV